MLQAQRGESTQNVGSSSPGKAWSWYGHLGYWASTLRTAVNSAVNIADELLALTLQSTFSSEVSLKADTSLASQGQDPLPRLVFF